VEEYLTVYVEGTMASSGAAIRVAMNALPAAVFLMLRKRFAMPPAQMKFWTYMCWSALAFIVLLIVSSSSTAIDRIALYWIPVQIVVWSRLPEALARTAGASSQYTYLVAAYSAVVLFVWLFYGENSYWWLPYRLYMFEDV
jgi:hypothetical protein